MNTFLYNNHMYYILRNNDTSILYTNYNQLYHYCKVTNILKYSSGSSLEHEYKLANAWKPTEIVITNELKSILLNNTNIISNNCLNKVFIANHALRYLIIKNIKNNIYYGIAITCIDILPITINKLSLQQCYKEVTSDQVLMKSDYISAKLLNNEVIITINLKD